MLIPGLWLRWLRPMPMFRNKSTSAGFAAKQLPPRRVILETEIEESFLKGSGPGGQKINKTSSAVQLKHTPTGIVVKSQETRSREQNRKLARQLLSEKLDFLERGDQSRAAIKTREAARKRASQLKKSRRKYRKLADEKATAAASAKDKSTEEPVADESPSESDGRPRQARNVN